MVLFIVDGRENKKKIQFIFLPFSGSKSIFEHISKKKMRFNDFCYNLFFCFVLFYFLFILVNSSYLNSVDMGLLRTTEMCESFECAHACAE